MIIGHKIQFVNITLFIFLSCGLGAIASAQSAMPDAASMENRFTEETLNTIQLQAFHQRAQQKLQDFADLSSIISDPQYDLSLRKASIPMAFRLFESKTSLIRYYDFRLQEVKLIPLNAYLDTLLTSQSKIQFDFTILSESTPLIREQEHFWSITFLQSQKTVIGNYPSLKTTINILLKKKEKKFGTQTKFIWEVLLGDIDSINLIGP